MKKLIIAVCSLIAFMVSVALADPGKTVVLDQFGNIVPVPVLLSGTVLDPVIVATNSQTIPLSTRLVIVDSTANANPIVFNLGPINTNYVASGYSYVIKFIQLATSTNGFVVYGYTNGPTSISTGTNNISWLNGSTVMAYTNSIAFTNQFKTLIFTSSAISNAVQNSTWIAQ